MCNAAGPGTTTRRMCGRRIATTTRPTIATTTLAFAWPIQENFTRNGIFYGKWRSGDFLSSRFVLRQAVLTAGQIQHHYIPPGTSWGRVECFLFQPAHLACRPEASNTRRPARLVRVNRTTGRFTVLKGLLQQFPLWLSRKAAPLSADNFLLSADFLPQGFREKGADNSHAYA